MAEYSQAVCHDGAAIIRDGRPLTIEEILELLRERDELERQIGAVRKARNRIGDSTTGPAGLTAVHLLDKALKGEAL